MLRISRRVIALCLTSALVLGVFVATEAVGAVKHPHFRLKGAQNGKQIYGTVIAGSFGRGKYSGRIFADNSGSSFTMTFSGRGTVRVTTAAQIVGTKLKGTWRITRATGRYRGTKGKGKLSCDFTSGLCTFAAG